MTSRLLFLALLCSLGCKDSESVAPEIRNVDARISEFIPTVISAQWTTTAPAQTWVEYGQTDQYELGRVYSDDESTEHEVVLLGVPPETEITWRLGVDHEGDAIYTLPSSISTGLLPVELPDISTEVSSPDQSTIGYILSSIITSNSNLISILNDQGQFVWWYFDSTPGFWSSRARFAPDGSGVLYNRFDRDTDSGQSSVIVKVSWTGEEVQELNVPHTHHDFLVHEDGTLAAIVNEKAKDDRGVEAIGGGIHEIAPDGSTTEIWSAWDTLSPPRSMEEGKEWTHFNALIYDTTEEAYLVGSRTFNAIYKVDRSTGEMLWTMGGELSDWELSEETDTWFSSQHQMQVLDEGILIFDNRSVLGEPSRIVEYAWDEENLLLSQAMEYTDEEELTCYVLGDIHRMESGNTLVTWSTAGLLTEVSPNGEPIWELSLDLGSVFGYLEHVDSLGGQ